MDRPRQSAASQILNSLFRIEQVVTSFSYVKCAQFRDILMLALPMEFQRHFDICVTVRIPSKCLFRQLI